MAADLAGQAPLGFKEPGGTTFSYVPTPTGVDIVEDDRASELIRRTCWNDRVQRFGRLLGDGFRVCDDRLDGPMAFVKNSDVAQGLGHVQWHQDDGLGGHPVMCPLLQVGVQLDHSNPENG